jgi:hypothetical protein
MDISNLITATDLNTTRGAIIDPLANKITELTGYHWQMYMLKSEFIVNVYPAIHNFFFHSWLGLIAALIMLIVLGEVFFYNDIKKVKVGFNVTTNEFITEKKLLSYVKSFFVWVLVLVIVPLGGLMVSIIILNLHIFLILLISAISLGLVFVFGILLFLKVIITINRKLFSHLIKKETAEEYEARQAQYQFRDGSIVKIKPNISEVTKETGKHIPGFIRDLSKAQGTYIIKSHNGESKAKLKDSKDHSPFGPSIREIYFDEAPQVDKDKFLKEQAEYNLKEAERKKGIWDKLNNWIFGV